MFLGVGLATGGGPIGPVDGADDGVGPGNAFERGVSGANVVAGDVGNPGRTSGNPQQ